MGNQLGRFEVDRERPELVAFNGWRQKFLMDNPDFRYWVADVRADRRYRITGNRGDAIYLSVTAYRSGGTTDAQATARLDSDRLTFDGGGSFAITVGGSRPATGDWLELPDGATSLWVRQFHDDVHADRPGWCAIEPLDATPVPAVIDPPRFAHQVGRLASTMSSLPRIFAAAVRADEAHVNELREWSEMTGGAVFTEPNIHYLRGGWQLAPGEALVIEGEVVPCRYWNVLLYSRFLNSLDHRWRPVSRTGATATVEDGRYRFVLAAEDPGRGTVTGSTPRAGRSGSSSSACCSRNDRRPSRRAVSWRSTICAAGDDRLATRPPHRGRAGAVRGRRRRPAREAGAVRRRRRGRRRRGRAGDERSGPGRAR